MAVRVWATDWQPLAVDAPDYIQSADLHFALWDGYAEFVKLFDLRTARGRFGQRLEYRHDGAEFRWCFEYPMRRGRRG